MAKFLIKGGKPLAGAVTIRGSKNTALPLIAACLLTEEPCVLENVPDISDVAMMVKIAENLGVNTEWDREGHRLVIRAKDLRTAKLDETLSRKLRGSVLFSGALLARLRKVTLPYPGGDAIGARPLSTHFHALEALGARVNESDTIVVDGQNLHATDVTLEEPSVTATENTILAAVLAPGKTTIRLAAGEPHVQELVLFLNKMGADIHWRDILRLEITGARRLKGTTHAVNADELEVSSFAILAAASRSQLDLQGVNAEYLDAVFLQLKKMGVHFELQNAMLRILRSGSRLMNFRVQSGLYPKLGSDHLPPFAVLATQAEGESLIHEWLYENRLRYIPELQKMGAKCTILDPHRALIVGPTKLHGGEIASLDIRTGMTLIIAALVAEGQSAIADVEHIDRGYEQLEERLQAIGADIQRVNA